MTINCKGQLIDLSTPRIMGILNITPDSFYDGGVYKDDRSILKQTEKMLFEGATFIDIGAYSSRPNANHISESEELARLIPALEIILKNFPDSYISVDTFRSNVAKIGIETGACIINDISGGNMDSNMFDTVAFLQVPYILMHMKGTPQNMETNSKYNNVTQEVLSFFAEKTTLLKEKKVNDIILDLGFGFGKTLEHNYELLKKMELFKNMNLPILTGISRKSMLYKLLDTDPSQALNATSITNTIALQKGSSILRVHDVKEALEAIIILQQIS
jgi:dihydropteroate synthase|tara:strand:+ start:1288 stop:2109 length:822 start_codon:yes stop_codon:yes gene_type:complete